MKVILCYIGIALETVISYHFSRLSELRQQKQKLSRQVRDKEEELETSLQKIDSLRQDIRKAEKLRRELELRSEESANEAAKGIYYLKKIQCNELYCIFFFFREKIKGKSRITNQSFGERYGFN